MIELDLLEGQDLVDAVSVEVMGWSRGQEHWLSPVSEFSPESWNPHEDHGDKIAVIHQILELGATQQFLNQWRDMTDGQLGIIELMMCDPETICLCAVGAVRELNAPK